MSSTVAMARASGRLSSRSSSSPDTLDASGKLHAHHSLEGGVVGTLMSNFGLAMALDRLGIPFQRAKVGDRFVMEMMAAVIVAVRFSSDAS